MKNIIKRITYLTLLISLGFSCGTRDGLSDKEILALDQQGWKYSIQLKNPYTNQNVAGATLKVVVDGDPKTLTSNSAGTVEFEAGYLGQFNVSVSKEGYFDLEKQIEPYGNDRTKIITYDLILFPSTGEGTITIKGNMTVQSDLTTAEKEPAAGASIYVDFYYKYNFAMQFKGQADSEGNYSLQLPALDNNNYGYYRFSYGIYSATQKIAINRYSEEPAFPETLPSLVNLETAFDPSGSFVSIPNVQPVYATSPAAPAGVGSQQANPFYLSLDGNGGVNLGTFGLSSTGAGYTAGDKPLTIVSIFGGSGATGVIRDTNANGTLDQYDITGAGSGYPKTTFVNAVSTQGFSASRFANNGNYYYYTYDFKSGTIFANNVFFGTGTTRERDVN